MQKTLEVLNELEREGTISRYAIGRAIGAMFYAEPVSTFDLDIFCMLPNSMCLECKQPDFDKLEEILVKHELLEKWKKAIS